jgi:hypothetical protein
MDIKRICAIFVLTLCTTLLATGFNTTSAIINAVLMAGIASSSEILKNDGEPLKKFALMIDRALIL